MSALAAVLALAIAAPLLALSWLRRRARQLGQRLAWAVWERQRRDFD